VCPRTPATTSSAERPGPQRHRALPLTCIHAGEPPLFASLAAGAILGDRIQGANTNRLITEHRPIPPTLHNGATLATESRPRN